jgi:hypothetical protein
MALAAITSLLLLGACGSSSSSSGNQVGFSNSSLNGTYVFSSTGTDSTTGAFLAAAGAITADGSGHITGGNVDLVDPNENAVSQAVTGSYTINQDGRGLISIAIPTAGTFVFDIVLYSTNHGLVTEFDGFGSGSGTIDLQTSLTGVSQLAGAYALSMAGTDINGNPAATAGSFTLNSSGAVSAGYQDVNDNGFQYSGSIQTTSGVTSLGTGTAPGTFTLTGPFGTATYDFYPVDATHVKFIETDYNNFLAGDVYTQTGAAIPASNVAFTMGGTDSNGPIGVGGLATTDASGNFTNGAVDVNDAGNVTTNPLSFSGSAGAAGVGGRVVVTLSGFYNSQKFVVYPTTNAGVLMLEADNAAVMLGAAYAQTGTSFAASENYGMNLTGENSVPAFVNIIAQFNTGSTTISGLLDDNESGTLVQGTRLSGTYTAPTSGRGTIVVPSLAISNGGLGLYYYVVNGTTTLVLEGDQQQVTIGSFIQQTTPTSQAALLHPMVALMHPANHAHGAVKPGQKWTPQNK